MRHKPIRASLTFDLDGEGLIVVETMLVQDERNVVLHVSPGGVRRGQQVSVYLDAEKARALAKQLEEAARGA